MNSNKDIRHSGKVVEITPEITRVEIISESACSACHAKGLCSLGESKVKVVEVPTSAWMNLKVGDTVDVLLKTSMGFKAVWLAYAVPLVVLVATLMGLLAAGVGEVFAALGSIALVALYYLVIWLFRNRLRNEYTFKIQQQ